jgi:hypothetical protein
VIAHVSVPSRNPKDTALFGVVEVWVFMNPEGCSPMLGAPIAPVVPRKV